MHLKNKFDVGEFAILAEMEPPKGVDISGMVANAARVKGVVDAFVVPEMSNAVMRMSALGGAMILQKKGMETVVQVCCRDRNRIALQADLLAAYGCGITNVMAVKGEDPSYGDHHEAKAVYDIELMELLQVIQKLQTGRDMAGVDLLGSPQFLVGSTINAGVRAEDLDAELEEMNRKREAGAEFFVSPPLFDIAAIEPFLKQIDRRKVNLIPTVLLLKSFGMVRYIDRNLDHIHVPGALIDRIQKAPDKVRECIRVAAEMISTLKEEGFKGVLISTMGWENRLPEVLGGFGIE
ncbi:MAG: methylenetetrahydrofolate reductase [Deltaproteobacteria bacterium]|nr:methylenetetrahydrofolate reductase [Deltaproteobacteria bacterium]